LRAKTVILDRITLDVDYYETNFRLKALRAWHALHNLDEVEDVVVHISTSGRGLHIQGHLSKRLPDETRTTLRREFGDDLTRTRLDESRGSVGHATDIYWAEKSGNDGEREEMPDVWAALDRLESTRAPDYSRVKALALHGHRAVHDQRGLNRASLAEGL
jgi:hypothetical protein